MDLILKTHGIGQKNGKISIDEAGISFAGRSIRAHEVTSITSSIKSSREVLYSTVNARITIKARSESMVLKFSGSDGMFQRKFDEVVESFMLIRSQVIQNLGPVLLNRMIQSISGGGNLKIGRFIVNNKGITIQTTLRGELRAGWDEEFELRPKSKENLLLKCLNFGFSAQCKFDSWDIVYHNKSLGRMIRLGEFSFDDENGCMMPFLIDCLKKGQRP